MTIRQIKKYLHTCHVWFSYISFHCLFPNHALVLKHGGTRARLYDTGVHVHKQPLRGFSEPFCHSDKAIMLKGPAPRECYRPCPFSFLRPPCFLTSHSFLSFSPTCFLSLLYHYRPTSHSIQLYASLFTNELGVHMYAQGIHARHERERRGGGGGGTSKLHTYRAQMLLVQEWGRAHRWSERVQHTRMHATHT